MNIRRGLLLVLGIVACGVLSGCVNQLSSDENTRFSPLEVRAVQTRTYDGIDTKSALKTVLNVLLDEGYLVDFGDAELGLLRASKTLSGRQSGLYRVPSTYRSQMEATVTVSDFGEDVKIRISFHQMFGDFSGYNSTTSNQIVDPRHYQDFFAKLDRGLFIQKQGL